MSEKNGTAPCSDPKGVFPFNCSVDLTQWRKQSEQALSCSRKWRNTEDPPQELHSSLPPLKLFSANASGLDRTLGFLCLFWGRCPPAMYDVCYSQAGGKAVSARWVCCGWHKQWRRQTKPITRGARGLLLVWVVVAASVLNFATYYWIFSPPWSEVSPAQLRVYLLILFISGLSTFIYLGELSSCSLCGQILIFLLFLSALLRASVHFPLAVHWQYCLLSYLKKKKIF